ncbi:MAG: group 1 glycosyl transferase [Rhodospirillaceae bacterium]|nr:group 1 glycosyl transferase [Rhodospirillaceae bacterium]|tara:strand:+ start:408 stop:1523 length:1116 start_codon:yes stop_codon:yes gene_type:complete
MAAPTHNKGSQTVLHVITDLNTGGAETMLAEMVLSQLCEGNSPIIVSLIDGGSQFERLKKAGCQVIGLGMRRGRPSLIALFRLAKFIREYKPKFIQSWMYHADLASLISLYLSGRRRFTKLIWGIRCSDMDPSRYGLLFRVVLRLCALLSPFPDGIVANSYAGLDQHRSIGYRPRNFAVVHNGFDTDHYKFDANARDRIRQSLKIADDAFVVGVVARVDPMKDYPTLLTAISTMRGISTLAIGKGTEGLSSAPGLMRLGERSDVADMLSAIDVLVVPSAFGEGLSNVIGEAMATERPIVATDVGDAAHLVGEAGIIVPPKDPVKLAAALEEVKGAAELRIKMGGIARDRIMREFQLTHTITKFSNFYSGLR